ncbi:MAG: FHA domain-containing protein [Byssovorax sp.]
MQRSTLRSTAQFETDVPTGRGSIIPPALGSTEASVVPIRKSLRSPYQDRISIGRARSCDVVIRDASISKLQAYVFTGEDGSHAIVDVGSQNGTKIGSRLLVPQKPMPLKAGNILTLGVVVASTLDATSAHRALLRLHEGSLCR